MIPYGTGRSVLLVGLTTLLIYTLFFFYMYPVLPDFTLSPFIMLLPGALATACVSIIIWWRFLIKPYRFTIRRSILAGTVSSILAHPVIWMSICSITFIVQGRSLLG